MADVVACIQLVLENKAEPSTTFHSKLAEIYSSPKDVIINLLAQKMEIKQLGLLRDQLFFMFMKEFDEEILLANGFNFEEEDNNPKTLLKERKNTQTIATDIYSIGLSLHEGQITSKLASKILKPSSVHTDNNPLLQNHSKTILEKLQELITSNNKVVKENAIMKKEITNLNRKMDEQKEQFMTIINELKKDRNQTPSSSLSTETTTPPTTNRRSDKPNHPYQKQQSNPTTQRTSNRSTTTPTTF